MTMDGRSDRQTHKSLQCTPVVVQYFKTLKTCNTGMVERYTGSFGCCQAHRAYLLDFVCSGIQFYVLLSPYKSLLYLLFISWFICFLEMID